MLGRVTSLVSLAFFEVFCSFKFDSELPKGLDACPIIQYRLSGKPWNLLTHVAPWVDKAGDPIHSLQLFQDFPEEYWQS